MSDEIFLKFVIFQKFSKNKKYSSCLYNDWKKRATKYIVLRQIFELLF